LNFILPHPIFITAKTPFHHCAFLFIAHFVHHCTLKYALHGLHEVHAVKKNKTLSNRAD